MNYEKKYIDALERAKELCDVADTFTITIHDIYTIFPELQENEDERIRKAIKKALQVRCDGSRIISDEPVTLEEAIAWLEKQEFYTFEIKEGHWYKCICDYMLNGTHLMFKNDRLYYCRKNWRLIGEIDERNVKNIGVNGYKSFFRPATNQEIQDWLEKQDEKKSTEDAKKLDADKVIEWLNDQACLGWIEDIEVEKFVEQFKKDFEL